MKKAIWLKPATSNLFIVSDDVLKTPELQSGILPGITRTVVLELAAGSGLKALETDIAPVELLSAEEVFLTNSVMELMPVTKVGIKRSAVDVRGRLPAN